MTRTVLRDSDRANDAAIMTYLAHEYSEFYEFCYVERHSIDKVGLKFKSVVAHCVESFVPTVRKRTKKHNLWITREIIHIKRRIKRLRKSNKHVTVPGYRSQINALTRSLKNKIRNAKRHFCKYTLHTFIKESPHKFWQYMNSMNTSPVSSCFRGQSEGRRFQCLFSFRLHHR